MNQNKYKKIIFGFIGLALLGGIAYIEFPLFKGGIVMLGTIAHNVSDNKESIVHAVKEEIFTTPLKSSGSHSDVLLTNPGVIQITNQERIKAGLPSLTENDVLDKAAENKLKDMFDKQYFEHVSPAGHGPGYVVEHAGYTYVVVGENLALGNFKDDADLVAAWMASPGHRANILNNRYTEIGVAVGEGMYKGSKTWIAVQEFGKPASDCPSINTALKALIDSEKKQTDTLSANLTVRKEALYAMPKETPLEQNAYNEKVAEYNALVKTYNQSLILLHTHVDTYNNQVKAFNVCVKN